jgi:hypothetical protein
MEFSNWGGRYMCIITEFFMVATFNVFLDRVLYPADACGNNMHFTGITSNGSARSWAMVPG